jgi:CRISPR-associated endoribonuclease Cas6
LEHHTTLAIPPLPSANGGTPQSLSLHIHTPLRLQQQGQPLRADQLTPRTLVAAIARRVALVLEFHAHQPDWGQAVPDVARQAEALIDTRDLHWHDWTRYSSRQQQEMTLGGVLGTWQLSGTPQALTAIWPWLWLGQWLHVGKNATMGMGGYTLEASA